MSVFSLNIDIQNPLKLAKRVSKGYEYNVLSFAADESNAYSIVTNTDNNRIFAYSAPKQTQSVDDFYNDGDVVQISEAIEGTMLTFFWNPEISVWELCTRNGVGGDYTYSQPIQFIEPEMQGEPPLVWKTFREMALDVFRIRFISLDNSASHIADFSDIPHFDDLSKDLCYTCILNHPDNHLVYETLRFCMTLKLVSITSISGETPKLTEVTDPAIWEAAHGLFQCNYANSKQISSKAELKNLHAFNQITTTSEITDSEINDAYSVFHPPAWILTNADTGHRVEIANVNYQRAKELRNMQPNARYLWLDLKHKGLTRAYLSAFPMYRRLFDKFQIEYDRFVGKVYDAYVNFYILKQRESAIPKKYFVHAAIIHHNVYLPSLMAGQKQPIRIFEVKTYFEQFTASKMFYHLTKPILETSSDAVELDEPLQLTCEDSSL